MRESRRDSILVTQYAEKMGFSLRSAQMHRKQNHPSWAAFYAEAAAKEHKPSMIPGDSEEEQAFARYSTLSELLQKAIVRGDSQKIQGLIRNSMEAHKLLGQIREANLQHRRNSGALVSLSSVSELIHGNLSTLRGRLDDLPEVVSSRITDSALDVAGIVRGEVHSILKELEAAAAGIPAADAD